MSARQKLTDAQVLWIRKMAARRNPDGTRRTYATLAKCVGCSATHVRDIVHGLRRTDSRGANG
jgi:hypothetical protein